MINLDTKTYTEYPNEIKNQGVNDKVSSKNRKIQRLFEAAERGTYVKWINQGKSIKIANLAEYYKNQHGKVVNISSINKFFSKRNFSKRKNEFVYTHPHFQKGRPELLNFFARKIKDLASLQIRPLKNVPIHKKKVTLISQSDKRSVKSRFISTLLAALSQQNSYLQWKDEGRSFQIVDKDEFTRVYPGIVERNNKFNSFIRQLNFWGFQSLGNLKYFHPLFIRGDMESIAKIKRNSPKREKTVFTLESEESSNEPKNMDEDSYSNKRSNEPLNDLEGEFSEFLSPEVSETDFPISDNSPLISEEKNNDEIEKFFFDNSSPPHSELF